MSVVAVNKRLITSEEYHKMGETGLLKPDERMELINGEIFTMAPIGTRYFASVNKINALFVPVFVDQYIVSIQNCIHVDKWNEPEPDLVILKKDKKEYSKILPGPNGTLVVVDVSDITYSVDKKSNGPYILHQVFRNVG
ncbi:Uma2 family endonuclease [Membranicola marinus]|uniref:Uma2 family endonuclease n=1 Tax=Membranihabitans marinus TaxID=1227546 RepID=A0A953HLX1_9BACT|nr:Uma2 family endonuclease [Membranihabitans marinus]MBY5956918.1 Uma2 family endonuclease [Membranihabitans marinus]